MSEGSNGDEPEYPFPLLSVAERDRRWKAVREKMMQRDFAAIVAPENTGHSDGFQANSRYLTQCGGGVASVAVIFPLSGEVTATATTAVFRWSKTQNWVTDIREARRDYGKVIIERLRELGIDRHRVGVVGLGRGTRTPEGIILHETARRLMREFPRATFVDASELMMSVRMIKSEEEIAFLTKSVELIEAGYAAEFAAAKAGAFDYAVFAEATAAMLRGGAEPTAHSNWISGKAPRRTLNRPSHRQLRRGDIILNEIVCSWAGYRAQGVQPICVETCDPEYVELMKLQTVIFDELLAMMQPGITVGELAQACEKIVRAQGPRTGIIAGATASLTMHGRGLGDEGPIVTGNARDPHQLRTELRSNMTLIFKPSAQCADRSHPINWGDTILVTDNGGRRLGKREQGLWIAPA